MRLKRLYNFEAPADQWFTVEEPCPTCGGRGVQINEANDGVEPCPDCEAGVRTRTVPPLVGVRVLYAGPRQNFSPNLVTIGRAEGWLSIDKAATEITIDGADGDVVYNVLRRPGQYMIEKPTKGQPDRETLNWYECETEDHTNG